MDKNNLSYDELLSKLKAVDAASKQVKANMAAEAKAEAKAAEKTAKYVFVLPILIINRIVMMC